MGRSTVVFYAIGLATVLSAANVDYDENAISK
jgi:hypothetical protein